MAHKVAYLDTECRNERRHAKVAGENSHYFIQAKGPRKEYDKKRMNANKGESSYKTAQCGGKGQIERRVIGFKEGCD